MSGELGLFTANGENFNNRILGPMTKYRGNDGTAGRECSFEEYMQGLAQNNEGGLGLTGTDGKPLTWEHIWCDLGMDPARTTIDNLISLSGYLKYLAPEMIREFIWLGMTTKASHLDLVASSQNVDSLVVTQPRLYAQENYGGAVEMQQVAEGETFPEGKITWDYKSVRIEKQAIALKMSDEIILSVPIPLLQPYLSWVGVNLGAKLYKLAIQTMINGDQADGTDACAVVGVGDASKGAVFEDFVTMWTRSHMINMDWENLVTSEKMANQLLALAEFKELPVFGVLVELATRNKIFPANVPHFVTTVMSDDQALFFDKQYALQYLIFRALLVESERIVMRQINGTAVSLMTGFTTIIKWARVMFDQKKAFSDYPFPSSMQPIC